MVKNFRYCILVALLAFSARVVPQNYTRDAGIRLGDHFSATYRQYQGDKALEGVLFAGRQGVTIGVLKEFFQPAFSRMSDNLYFEYGFGAHIGYRYTDHFRILNRTYQLEKFTFSPLLGIDGLAGLEYRFPEFPFLIGVDVKPYFEYSTIQIFGLYLQSIGISLKYKF